MISYEIYQLFLLGMSLTAVFVFIALQFVKAGYGIMVDKKWGVSINNKIGWIIMEVPVFITMFILWWFSERRFEPIFITFLVIFQIHYFQRSFIFPLLIKGKNKMPLSIIAMGFIFNILNALMQGGWLFYYAPDGMYNNAWFTTPQFIIGVIIYFSGMFINIQSDSIIRNLRKPGDTNHYLPKGGMFNHVTSANYLGEIIEWTGFAILTWSVSGVVFVLWTFANLVPRANAIHKTYKTKFGNQVSERKLYRIFPYIY